MPSFLHRTWRRLRFGEAIIVVSGLPRSGTSMMMRMLEAGGLTLLVDGIRQPDEANPLGYYELEPAKDLATARNKAWLHEGRGKVVKIVSPLLRHLPDSHNYHVIFMQRDLAEIVASQNKMLAAAGEATDVVPEERLLSAYRDHLWKARYLLGHRACFDLLEVSYREALEQPVEQARRIERFLGRRLAVDRMADAVDERLYRNRR
jgi:hypothetical protein